MGSGEFAQRFGEKLDDGLGATMRLVKLVEDMGEIPLGVGQPKHGSVELAEILTEALNFKRCNVWNVVQPSKNSYKRTRHLLKEKRRVSGNDGVGIVLVKHLLERGN